MQSNMHVVRLRLDWVNFVNVEEITNWLDNNFGNDQWRTNTEGAWVWSAFITDAFEFTDSKDALAFSIRFSDIIEK